MPLYINGIPVGGIGVAGDLRDQSPVENFRDIFAATPYGKIANNRNGKPKVFNGTENPDFDESVAMAGRRGYSAPERIRATHIVVGGLRFPFTASPVARGKPVQTIQNLIAGGGHLLSAPVAGLNAPTLRAGEPERVTPGLVVSGVPGLLRITSNVGHVDPVTGIPDPADPHTDPQDSDPIVGSHDTTVPAPLTAAEVMGVIQNSVHQATITRAGIRKPNGVNARVHVAVVDTQGNVLGVFRMEDGTNFSYDIAVQKARTAALFSDDTHAFTPRAIGFMSQKFFPIGIDTGLPGPLSKFQDKLSFGDQFSELQQLAGGDPTFLGQNLKNTPFHNGVTIFPGGVPLYKNGVLVGAVGVSGDGVDQDDIIAFAGTKGFEPPDAIRADKLPAHEIATYIVDKLQTLEALPNTNFVGTEKGGPPKDPQPSELAARTLEKGLRDIRLPYVKFPRTRTSRKGSCRARRIEEVEGIEGAASVIATGPVGRDGTTARLMRLIPGPPPAGTSRAGGAAWPGR